MRKALVMLTLAIVVGCSKKEKEPAAETGTDPLTAVSETSYDRLTALSDVLERDPNNETALCQRAELFANAGDHDFGMI